MGEKDTAEKYLEEYEDVFADIINVCLFDGRQVVAPTSLEATSGTMQYKEENQLHEMK